jgi:triacylglycerol esterase/lipase EstA (alpha/beta hydrolase family)
MYGCTKNLDELGHQGRAESFKVTNKAQANPISISTKIASIYEEGKKKACAQMQQTHTSVMFQGMVMKEIMLLPT